MNMQVRGYWSAADSRGFVNEVRIDRRVPQPTAPEEWWVFRDWQRLSEDVWIAGHAEGRTAEGYLRTVMRLAGTEPFDDARFEQLTAVPRYDQKDPVRGELTFTRLRDYRTNQQIRLDGDRLVPIET